MWIVFCNSFTSRLLWGNFLFWIQLLLCGYRNINLFLLWSVKLWKIYCDVHVMSVWEHASYCVENSTVFDSVNSKVDVMWDNSHKEENTHFAPVSFRSESIRPQRFVNNLEFRKIGIVLQKTEIYGLTLLDNNTDTNCGGRNRLRAPAVPAASTTVRQVGWTTRRSMDDCSPVCNAKHRQLSVTNCVTFSFEQNTQKVRIPARPSKMQIHGSSTQYVSFVEPLPVRDLFFSDLCVSLTETPTDNATRRGLIRRIFPRLSINRIWCTSRKPAALSASSL